MKKTFLVTIFAFALVSLCLLAIAEELPPIPSMPDNFRDIKIIKPAASVPKEVADFVGEWEGIWTGDSKAAGKFRLAGGHDKLLRAKIIIYEVDNNTLKGLFGRGESPYFRGEPGWYKFESEIITFNERKRFSFRFHHTGGNMQFYTENNLLIGTQGINSIEMRRVK